MVLCTCMSQQLNWSQCVNIDGNSSDSDFERPCIKKKKIPHVDVPLERASRRAPSKPKTGKNADKYVMCSNVDMLTC